MNGPDPSNPVPTALIAAARVEREWIVTNGLGGYASGTIAGSVTRRYHGVLVAALPAPVGRMVMLSHLDARVRPSPRADVTLRLEPPPDAADTASRDAAHSR